MIVLGCVCLYCSKPTKQQSSPLVKVTGVLLFNVLLCICIASPVLQYSRLLPECHCCVTYLDQVKQDGRSASDHLRLRDSSGSATGEPRVLEERPGQQLHVKVEQPDLQDFTAALRELTAGLNDCTSSLKEATLELKQACADLRQSSKGA